MLTRPTVDQWVDGGAKHWDSAIKGSSCLREALARAIQAEAAGALLCLASGQPETQRAVADAGALPEVVGDGALLPVADAAAWAEVMADDRSEAADVIKRRSAAAAACSWSRASRQWLDALRAISSSRS